ncbi:MAG: radical SAM domain-containing protein [Desulfobacterales bacterium]|nr:radical SAM domain-containing protein [Desulfobacterales bacterium]
MNSLTYECNEFIYQEYHDIHIKISLNKQGERNHIKVGYPVRYGCFHEIQTDEYLFQFNLNGEIKYIQGIKHSWPQGEWLKRTIGNDWIYYSSGGYNGVYDLIGEYYAPCFTYPSNGIIGGFPFENQTTLQALKAWETLPERIHHNLHNTHIPHNVFQLLNQIIEQTPHLLEKKAAQFHELVTHISVLPPDTRHVDYDVIPIMIADGCLYNCGFCKVKSNKSFRQRTQSNIDDQIFRLKDLYADDLVNYNSVFLGQHDAMFADIDLIDYTARKAYSVFNFANSNFRNAYLFLFGSVDALLRADKQFFDTLAKLPYYVYINIGFESVDQDTLLYIKKPLKTNNVRLAFHQMLAVNKTYPTIEITANFVIGDMLPQTHKPTMLTLLHDDVGHHYTKGCIYLSPLETQGNRRQMHMDFYKLKSSSRLPTYLYIIQQL